MRAVRGTECVVHIEVAKKRQLLCESGIIAFFFLVETQVFQQKDVAILEIGNCLFGNWPDALISKSNFLAGKLLKNRNNWFETEFWCRSAFGTAQMRHQDQLPAGVHDLHD